MKNIIGLRPETGGCRKKEDLSAAISGHQRQKIILRQTLEVRFSCSAPCPPRNARRSASFAVPPAARREPKAVRSGMMCRTYFPMMMPRRATILKFVLPRGFFMGAVLICKPGVFPAQ